MDRDISVRLTHFLLLKRRRHPAIMFAVGGSGSIKMGTYANNGGMGVMPMQKFAYV